MPIVHQEEQIVKEIAPGADKLLANGEMNKLMARLGISAENAVQLAFATRGFNQWQPNFLATILRKKSSSPLIDTGQLRRSITSKVVNKHG
jgi:phage gpG-like protein